MSLKHRKKISKEENAKIIKYQKDLENELNIAQTFAEYFLILGIDPRISMRTYLYNTEPNEIFKFYSNEIKPEILSKYPPMKKDYINVDNSILDICFPNNFKLEEFSSKPEPEFLHFLLDNYFYSIDYPHKYVTCLKFYESLESYYELNKLLQKKLGNNYISKIPKYDGGTSNENHFLDFVESDDMDVKIKNDRKNSDEMGGDLLLKKQLNKLKNLYFPKIICLMSLKPFYKEQELILKQLYDYYLSNEKKKIPLEKIILNLLCNIPLPPNGLYEISYKLNNEENENNKNEIKIKRHKYNELRNIDYSINFILSVFNIDDFLEIFKYSLYEIKTIAFSTKINHLCILINGILLLLYPFIYAFQVSSCIPNNAFNLLESISPYILGINQKYTESFFAVNKIEMSKEDLMIIDIDNKKLIIKTKEKKNYPDLPKSYIKKLKSSIEETMKKQKILSKTKNKEDQNLFSSIFFDFFITIMNDYSNYLNNDYFFNITKYKNSSIKGLFKIKEFINNHSNNEKNFLEIFVNSQMFGDFIFKKMLPKNTNDKMDILFFDESINKKNNEKILLFGKKKPLFFLTSKEYQYTHTYTVPTVKELSNEEKYRYENKDYIIKNLYLGQNIEKEYNQNGKFYYNFNYILFPMLNNDYFISPNYDYYFTTMQNDIDRLNTDILSKSNLNSLEEKDGGMLNYIYLAYVELWGYCYYYQKSNEKDYRFEQLISVLNKVYHHEIELFDLLFDSLNKFQEYDKILKLYERLLYYKLTPSSFIYSIISKIIVRDKSIRGKSNEAIKEEKNHFNDIEKYLKAASFNKIKNKLSLKLQKRTLKDENEKNIKGDLPIFKATQICVECGEEINIEKISLNYKNMKKDSLWAQCPLCKKYILPRLTVKIGSKVSSNSKDVKEENEKETSFILHSPYELKLNLKETINKDECDFFQVEKFKSKFPSLFWSCIWYFKINKIDYNIMLPYESNIFKTINKNKKPKDNKINANENKNNINPRRATTYSNSAKRYNSISEFLNNAEKTNNNNEPWKRSTMKDKKYY